MKNEELLSKLKSLVREERRITLEILHYLREVEARRLYAVHAYSSLHEFCVKELGYSSGAAYRRIESMRFLKDSPEVETKIQEGSLNLTTVSAVQTFLKIEKKENRREYDAAEKSALLEEVSGKSTREVERILAAKSPEYATSRKERERAISAEETEIRFVVDAELMQMLTRAKELQGGKNAHPDYVTLFTIMAREYLKRRDPVKQNSAPAPGPLNQILAGMKFKNRSRYIPRSDSRGTRLRAQAQCEYRDPITHRRCSETRALELDHRRPFAQGGANSAENLQLLCPAHNRLKALKDYGAQIQMFWK